VAVSCPDICAIPSTLNGGFRSEQTLAVGASQNRRLMSANRAIAAVELDLAYRSATDPNRTRVAGKRE